MRRRLVVAKVTGHDRNARLDHQRLGRILEAHRPDGGSRRSDKDQPRLLAGIGESRILGKKPVTRMDRFGPRIAGRLEDRINVEIALAGRRRTDAHRLVGHRHVQCTGIRVGVNGNRAQAQPLGRAHHAAGDLAAIGDQE